MRNLMEMPMWKMVVIAILVNAAFIVAAIYLSRHLIEFAADAFGAS